MPTWLLLASLPLLLASLTAHELAHGLVADALGDPTARVAGRLTANPLKHMDVFGSLLLVATLLGSGGSFMFGWAKPIPVDPRHFKSEQKGMMVVGAAGPLTNLALAVIAGLGVRLAIGHWYDVALVLFELFLLNTILTVINLIPIPPLDGARVLGGVLPAGAYGHWRALDRYGNLGFLAVLVLVWTRPDLFWKPVGWLSQVLFGVNVAP
jgi:Zn-dependent protease